MRIISNFKDCYDGLTSNSEPIYVRTTTEIALPYRAALTEFDIRRGSHTYWFRGMLLGLCGRVYPAFYLQDSENKQYKVYYSRSALVEDFPEVLERRCMGKWYEKAPRIDYCIDIYHRSLGYGLPIDEEKKFSPYFSVDTPAFIVYNAGRYDTSYLIKNPSLRKYEVYKLFPIPLLFQEIEMYLGGLARPDDKIPKISDIDMIEAKGFDKFSFRKDKSK